MFPRYIILYRRTVSDLVTRKRGDATRARGGSSRLCPVPCLALGFYGAWGLETMGRSPNERIGVCRLPTHGVIWCPLGFYGARGCASNSPLGFYGARGFNPQCELSVRILRGAGFQFETQLSGQYLMLRYGSCTTPRIFTSENAVIFAPKLASLVRRSLHHSMTQACITIGPTLAP